MRNLIPHFIQEQYLKDNHHGHFQAFTMFVDLSGFTSLTETLMKQGREGAEQLSLSLNNIFEPMVNLVYSKGGFIPYFAGDSFTAIFPETKNDADPRVLLNSALTLREYFQKHGLRKTRFGDFKIGMKIGLGFGDVEWGIVGDKKKSFYFRGDAINTAAQCQMRAKEQEVIFDEIFKTQFGQYLPEFDFCEKDYYCICGSEPSFEINLVDNALPNLSKKVLSDFFSKEVTQYNEVGEFRTVVSIFISFSGVNTHESLDQFVSVVLNQIDAFSGYFKEVDFGDKGGVLVAFFGAPITFENNVERALELIHALSQDLKELQRTSSLQFKIGVTAGTAYTGIVGGKERCQYAAVGHRVNIAARLMTYATNSEIMVDEVMQKSSGFNFEYKGDVHYKGVELDVPTYQFEGKSEEDLTAFGGKMVGRKEELIQLIDFAEPLDNNEFAGVAYVFGEAGIGKSRLSYEFRKNIKSKGNINWYICQADQILKKPLNPFIYFLKNYFNQSSENTPIQNIEAFEKIYLQLYHNPALTHHHEGELIKKELSRTKSILAAQVGINSSTSLWQQLDAKGRYENTLAALGNLFIAQSCVQPMVVEMEDAHWFDADSINLLQEMGRRMNRYPFFVLITSRYNDSGEKVYLFSEETIKEGNFNTLEIDLNILQPEAVKAFAESKLEAPISSEFNDLLLRTTNGNPFYAEQIIEYFAESNLLKKQKNVWHVKDNNVKISGSINAILMARIDRLSNLVKETVKAAAVIGREFEVPVLSEVMKVQEEFLAKNGDSTAVLKEQIQTAEKGQIWRAVNELRYIFKHSLLREAVYDMQLRGRLRHLHKLIAEAIEKLHIERIEERYADLAFHFGQAEVMSKTNEYLLKAADHNRLKYQNERALEFYDRLLDNLKNTNQLEQIIKVQLKKGGVLEMIGRWDECEATFHDAMKLARQQDDKTLLGRIHNNLGDILTLKGNYDEARTHMQAAATHFEFLKDNTGTYKVYGNLGKLYFRQGVYEEAKSYFTKSIELSHELNPNKANPQIVANLGLTHMNQGNYDEGIRWMQEELDICKKINDKSGMASLYTNMGIVYFEKGEFDKALNCYEEGLALSEELGNRLLQSIAIGCMGSVYQRKGDYNKALEHFLQDLTIGEELGDKQGTAIALGLLGELRKEEGEFELAIDYLEKNLQLSEELNYRKGIAKAVNSLGDIYLTRGEFDKAISYYDRAIDLSRKINNKLILGESLVEKGEAMIAASNLKGAQKIHNEALEIIERLGNRDLIYKGRMFSAELAEALGEKEKAESILKELAKTYTSNFEVANINYFLFKTTGKETYKKKALDRYHNLYSETPLYLFEERIKELKL